MSTGMLIFFLLLLLSQHTPLKRYCVHNTLPFASSSGLSPGIARPKFRGPRSASIARSQVWLGLPAGRFQSAVLVGYMLQGLGGGAREVNCEQYGRRAADVY